MSKQLLTFRTSATGYKTRTETFEGREHIVVPVVALVEGVVHAMNAAAPEFVAAQEMEKSVAGWNGRPVYGPHPMRNGRPVSGNSPQVLEQKSVGKIFNATMKGKKLVMEAWIDIEKCEQAEPELLQRLRDGAGIEVSVGVFVQMDESTGRFNGTAYEGAWHELVPDHLALLPEGDTGACSREMGCGVRAAQKGTLTMSKPKDKTNGSIFARLMETFRGAISPTESDRDVRDELYEALKAQESGPIDIVAVYSDRVVYASYGVNGMQLFSRAYTGADGDDYMVDGNRLEVEPVMTYEPVDAKQNKTIEPPAPKSASGNKEEKTNMTRCDTIKALVKGKVFSEADTKFLEGATEEQLERFLKAAEAPKEEPKTEPAPKAAKTEEPAPKVETPAVKDEPKAAEVKAPTFEDLVQSAAPEVRDLMQSGIAAGKARKAETIKTLKASGRCPYADAELEALNQAQLDKLVTLAGVQKAASGQIDYSGRGTARDESTAKEIPAPRSLSAEIRAAATKK